MLDPLSGVALAGTIVQFVDFGVHLVSGSIGIYHSASGSTATNAELEVVTKDLREITESLIAKRSKAIAEAPKDSLKETNDLADLASTCQQVGDQLLKVLNGIKIHTTKNRKLASFESAIKGAWRKTEIKELSNRLDNIRVQLNTKLLALLNNRQMSMISLLKASCQHFDGTQEGSLARNATLQNEVEALKQSLAGVIKDQDLQRLRQQIDSMINEWHAMDLEIAMLNSLQFEDMKRRQTLIKEEHPNTFMWIFDTEERRQSVRDDFEEWLKAGKDIYWVSGKAGSGKSTLMKFLSTHENTFRSLEQWASGRRLILASHFFWSSGSLLQKSQEGLLRTLLYEILRQCPDLIPVVSSQSPFRASLQGDSRGRRVHVTNGKDWDLKQLATAFAKIKSQTSSAKFCLFVDGLDEYDGDQQELITILKTSVTSSNIKLCVSSRPWNIFEEEFHDVPHLRLEELTREDMGLFIRDRLEQDPRFLKLRDQDPRYGVLVQTISERANGVFLWVVLVINSLRKGLPNRDTLGVFQKRVDEVPSDLEQFFRKILNSVDSVYHANAAKIFLTALTEYFPMPIVLLEGILHRSGINHRDRLQVVDATEARTICETLAIQIKACCTDLLEVFPPRHSNVYTQFYDYKVTFLHKSVKDFLETKDMQNWLRERTESDFDPVQYLAVENAITSTRFFSHSIKILHRLEDALQYAKVLEDRDKACDLSFLDELEHALLRLPPSQTSPAMIFNATHDRLLWPRGGIAMLAVKQSLCTYVTAKYSKLEGKSPRKSPDINEWILWPGFNPLALVLTITRGFDLAMPRVNLDLLKVLLELNANPNENRDAKGRTCWYCFVETLLCQEKTDHDTEMFEAESLAVELLLQYGADPGLEVTLSSNMIFRDDDETYHPSYELKSPTFVVTLDQAIPQVCEDLYVPRILDLLQQKRRELKVGEDVVMQDNAEKI